MKQMCFIHLVMKSRTTPSILNLVPGLPASARIYKIEASQFWQVRFYISGKYVRRSTQQTDKALAIACAKRLYFEALSRQQQNSPVHPTSFAVVAQQFLEWQSSQILLGQLGSRTHKEDVYLLNRYVLPFFGKKDVASVGKTDVDQYLGTLAEKKLSKSTLNKHVVVVRKVLKFAAEKNLIRSLPRFPSLGQENNPRPYFDLDSYRTLLKAANDYGSREHTADYIVRGKVVRKLKYTLDFADLIEFSVNCFVRISDLKNLRHMDVTVHRAANPSANEYLEIYVPHSKTHHQMSVTMQKAVTVYDRLRQRHAPHGPINPEDFIFFPHHRNRDYALKEFARLFRNILDDLGLRQDSKGKSRTIYSLRHTALMFRILYGKNIDIFVLAKNALTSVDMLEKFYLSHVQGRMKIKEIQSWQDDAVLYMAPGSKRRLR